jgi:zinc protease
MADAALRLAAIFPPPPHAAIIHPSFHEEFAMTARACLAAALCLVVAACSTSETATPESVSPVAPAPLSSGKGQQPNRARNGLTLPESTARAVPTAKPNIPAGDETHRTSEPTPSARSVPTSSVAQRILDEPTRRVLKLANGYTIILQQNKIAPVVAARIYVKAGSLTEQKYMGAGISHVLEHLVAGASSSKRKEQENTLVLQEIGNDSNAYTTTDHTCYFITTTKDKWPVALDLLADWTTAADFTREQFNREYQVVQRELEMGEAEAERTFFIQAATTRYLVSPLRHPVVGYKPAFQKLTFEDAKAYYKQMYVPDNMIVSIAGDIDLDAAEKLAVATFSPVERKVVPAIAIPPENPVIIPRRSVAWADVKQARVMWTFPTTDLYSPDLYATDVLSNILGGGESSLLVKQIRDDQSLVYDISSYNETPSAGVGGLSIAATVDVDKILPAQNAILESLNSVIKDGVTEEQLKRAKAQSSATLVYDNQTAEQQASRNATDFLSTGNIDFTTNYVHNLEKVTAKEVQAVAQKYLVEHRLLTTALLPLNAPNPFKVKETSAAAASAKDTTTKSTLKNGITLLITPNHSAPIVTFQLYTRGGALAETAATSGTGNAMMKLLTRGTTSRSHEQIADFLDATATSLSGECGNNTFGVSAQCLKQNAAGAFELFADVILHPKFAPEEFDKLRPQLLAAIDESAEDWSEEAYKAVKEEFYADSPYKRFPVGDAEVVKRLTAEQIRKHYESFFLNPRQSVLSIAGDIDEKTAEEFARTLEAMPAPASPPTIATTSTMNPPHTVTRHTSKQSATIDCAFGPGSAITSSDRYALLLLKTHLGGFASPGGSVLFETLRGKGLVYTVSANNVPSALPSSGGMFLIEALGQPDKSQPIIDAINAIVSDVKNRPLSDKALATVKDQAIAGELLSKQTIAAKSIARTLDELYGLGYENDAHFADNIKKVTAQDIQRAAQKYLQSPTIVILTPTAK